MERKCSNRRMAGEIRKTKYQSIRNPKPIHIFINTYVYTHAQAHETQRKQSPPTETHTDGRPTYNGVGYSLLLQGHCL
jgi:hypothetical protein